MMLIRDPEVNSWVLLIESQPWFRQNGTADGTCVKKMLKFIITALTFIFLQGLSKKNPLTLSKQWVNNFQDFKNDCKFT